MFTPAFETQYASAAGRHRTVIEPTLMIERARRSSMLLPIICAEQK